MVEPCLRLFVHRGRGRGGATGELAAGDPPSLGHVVQSVGVPLTEVGGLRLDGEIAAARSRAPVDGTLMVIARGRP
jgi:hypothetical protein